MVASYDCGIETNWEAWTAVHDGFRDGLTQLQISDRTGLSYQMVGIYRRQKNHASICRKLNKNHEGAVRCAVCGFAVAHLTEGRKCDPCQRRHARAHIPGRIEMLRSWALRHGRVPTVDEARDILGIGRSRAGDLVMDAFGKDHRDGFARLLSYRGCPEGAPDVPIPGALDELRVKGRLARERQIEMQTA